MSAMVRRAVLGAGLLAIATISVTFGVMRWRHHIPATADPAMSTAANAASGAVARPVEPPASAEASRPRTQAVELKRGDSLVRALAREGIDQRVGLDIAIALKQSGANLRKVKTNDTLEITWSLSGQPESVRYVPSPWLGYAVASTDGKWEARRSETRPDVRVEAVSGEVSSSLFEAVEKAGEPPQLVLDLVDIFSSDFDFTADTRSGDRFRFLVEKRYAGEQFVNTGRILVAQYLSDGRFLTGVSYERTGQSGSGYFDPSGRSLRKSFLKSPLEFTRITSGFTYARPHPILGGTRPHLAIDYAAPAGTPVRAVAHGAVTKAGWDGGNGISVKVRHTQGYETMYNHLSRLASGIKAGARVTQRQVIGYVGATGLATGPHLDYRVARGGQWVNPLKERFIPGDPIPAEERGAFLEHARALVRRLEDEAKF
jgi:murein DD-endopeptidase MepM/ murein hydrolase activator NlpD